MTLSGSVGACDGVLCHLVVWELRYASPAENLNLYKFEQETLSGRVDALNLVLVGYMGAEIPEFDIISKLMYMNKQMD